MNGENRLIIPNWPAPKNVKSFITTRQGGQSKGCYDSFNLSFNVKDDPEHVKTNRIILNSLLPQKPSWLKQIHGNRIVEADKINNGDLGDGMYTASKNQVCAIMIADCVPVMFCNSDGSKIGLVHAGWRGIVNGILENLVDSLKFSGKDTIVYLGPRIGPTAFEIGPDLFKLITSQRSFQPNEILDHKKGKRFADLYAMIENRLLIKGLDNIHKAELCTFNNPNLFFSHRQMETRAEWQLAFG